jgi:fused-like protein
MNYNGLRIIDKYALLEEDKTISVKLDVLSLVSHLARLSKDYYPKIQETKIIEKSKIMIKSEDPAVRSKVCNLIGNICRHSDYFYADIQKEGLIALAMECC